MFLFPILENPNELNRPLRPLPIPPARFNRGREGIFPSISLKPGIDPSPPLFVVVPGTVPSGHGLDPIGIKGEHFILRLGDGSDGGDIGGVTYAGPAGVKNPNPCLPCLTIGITKCTIGSLNTPAFNNGFSRTFAFNNFLTVFSFFTLHSELFGRDVKNIVKMMMIMKKTMFEYECL